MATVNLSENNLKDLNGKQMKFGIVVSEWNSNITNSLLDSAKSTLIKCGVKESNIRVEFLPGAFELPFGARVIAEECEVDCVIAIGCVIKGGTPHFDYVCQAVTYGMQELNMDYEIPFIFGVLTTDDLQQAEDRAGGKYGNKGDEAAITAIKMVQFNCKLKK